jgi:hypothetical protein
MINLLFLLATAQAAEVYDICVIEKQTWSDRYQKFEIKGVETFYTYQRPQLIVYKNSFELNRDRRSIIETTEKNGMTCWQEHVNSEICYDKGNNRMLWEWNTRAGATLRDVLKICGINGE